MLIQPGRVWGYYTDQLGQGHYHWYEGGPDELFEDVDQHDPLFYADIAEPQSLNKYHYVLTIRFATSILMVIKPG